MQRFRVHLTPAPSLGLPTVVFSIEGESLDIVRGLIAGFVNQRAYTIADIVPLGDPHTVPEMTAGERIAEHMSRFQYPGIEVPVPATDPHTVIVNGVEVSA